MRALVLLLAIALPALAADKPKPPTPKQLVRKSQPPPSWLAKAEDPKSPSNPFARGIYTTESEWLPLFKPSGKLAIEVKMKSGHTLRVYNGICESKPPTPASLEIILNEKRLFCARGHKFLNAAGEDLTGDEKPDIIRVTHASGLEPVTYHQFIFTFGQKFRVQTIGPFVNEK